MANTADIITVRRWWDRSPCNINHSRKPLGTREYFDEVEARKYTVEPHIPTFADFPRWADKRVLEIGCGIGTDTINFARAEARVSAIDLSQNSVGLTRQRAYVYDRDLYVSVWQGDAERMTLGSGYDLVYSFGVIHHSPHPGRIIRNADRALRPGGTLKIMVYHRRSWKVLWVLARYGWRHWFNVANTVAAHSEAQTGCPITYTYTRRQARQLVEQAGFKVVDIHVDHIFPYRIRDYKQGNLVKTWYWKLTPPSLFRKLERTFGWHLLVEAVKP